MSDLIERQAAKEVGRMTIEEALTEIKERIHITEYVGSNYVDCVNIEALRMAIEALKNSERTEKFSQNVSNDDLISQKAAIDALVEQTVYKTRDEIKRVHEEVLSSDNRWIGGIDDAIDVIEDLPPVQPERTCVNCGRTANNGGWYADGGTRCPIEEHYALPKDGYCHLWEKRNVTDDDYPERRTDE